MSMHEAVSEYTNAPHPKGKLGRAVKRRPLPEPVHEQPRDELRRLVKMHANWTRTSVALHHMRTDRKSRETGEIIPCLLTPEARADLERAQERIDGDRGRLESEMSRALRKTPIWQWLGGVYGYQSAGPAAAILVGETRIDIATKASKLKMFFGIAVDPNTGHMVRRVAGQKNRYHSGIRTALYQAFTAMRKNGAKVTANAPHGNTTKYLDIWHNAIFGAMHDPRFDGAKNTWCGRPGGRKAIGGRGMWKAADIFVEDLYTVWRALEGLPVWPDWYAVRLGYSHGGKICVNEPKMLTYDDAVSLVGDVGPRPLSEPRTWKTREDEVDEEEPDYD